MQTTSTSLADTRKVAQNFLNSLKSRNGAIVVALHGDLGAGKTVFTKIIAEFLGVELEVTSPTFVIEKVYEIKEHKYGPFAHLVHIDAYRLESSTEIKKLHWDEKIKDKKNLIVVEWPEKIEEVIPPDAYHLYFEFVDETTRKIEIK